MGVLSAQNAAFEPRVNDLDLRFTAKPSAMQLTKTLEQCAIRLRCPAGIAILYPSMSANQFEQSPKALRYIGSGAVAQRAHQSTQMETTVGKLHHTKVVGRFDHIRNFDTHALDTTRRRMQRSDQQTA